MRSSEIGLFDRFKKKEEILPEAFEEADTDIVALADGELIDETTVPDPVSTIEWE